jgi:hypothetical protein
MLKRLKAALVNSYVGAIATGWLVADGISGIISVVSRPLQIWYTILFYRELLPSERLPTRELTLFTAMTDLAVGLLRLLVALSLARWLYWDPKQSAAAVQTAEPEDSA